MAQSDPEFTELCKLRGSTNFDKTKYDSLPGELLRLRTHETVGGRKLILSAADSPIDLDKENWKTGVEIYTESASISHGVRLECDIRIQTTELLVMSPNDQPTIVTLSVSGENGQDLQSDDRTHGHHGSLLQLFAGHITCDPNAILALEATGGNGGSGASKMLQNEERGEPGGNGGNGGIIQVVCGDVHSRAIGLGYAILASHRLLCENTQEADSWAAHHRELIMVFSEACNVIYQRTHDPALQNWLPCLDGLMVVEWEVYPLEKETSIVQAILNVLVSRGDQSRWNLLQHCNAASGHGGSGGGGTTFVGAAGKKGQSGQVRVDYLSNIPESLCSLENIIPAHPDQCSMVLELARLNYFLHTEQSLSTCRDQLQRLSNRLSFVDHIESTDSLYQTYLAAEGRLNLIPHVTKAGESAAIATLRDVKSQAQALWQQLASQADYFGHQETYAPRGSYGFYQEMLEGLLENVRIAQGVHMQFYAKSRDTKTGENAVSRTRAIAQNSIVLVNRHIKKLKDWLEMQEQAVVQLNSAMRLRKNELERELKGVEARIQKAIPVPGCGWMDFIEAASMLCFCPSAPMAIIQGTGLAVKAFKNRGIRGSDGDIVKPELLIESIHTITKGDDLMSAYQDAIGANSSLDVDEAAAPKLIVQKEKIMELLKDFREGLLGESLDTLASAFQRYIDVTIERNNAVLQYNLYANGLQQKLQARQEQEMWTNTAATQAQDPDLPAASLYMERMYQYNIWATLEVFYMAQQALRFWGLNDSKPIQDALGDNPTSNLHYAVLAPMRTNMLQELAHAVETFGVDPSHLSSYEYPIDARELEILKTTGQTVVQIPVVRRSTKLKDSPLAGLCGIRLTKSRFFLEGATSGNDRLRLSITHLGQETIVDNRDVARDFVHPPVTIPFQYKISTAPKVEKGESQTIDAEIGKETEGKTTGQYALVGPFASWHIEVSKDWNDPTLDLTKVTKAFFVFEGSAFDFRQQ